MNKFQMLTGCVLAFSFSLTSSAQSTTTRPATAANPRVAVPAIANQKKPVEPFVVTLAQGKLELTAPGAWKKVAPKSRILEAELQVSAAEGDPKNSRLTIMRAGGSLPENVARWEGQFGGAKAKVTDEVIGKVPVKFVDISGTFADSMGGGPFAGGKKVARPDYRMLAAIIQTEEIGNYFLKFIGPKKTIEANAQAFKKMVVGMQLR